MATTDDYWPPKHGNPAGMTWAHVNNAPPGLRVLKAVGYRAVCRGKAVPIGDYVFRHVDLGGYHQHVDAVTLRALYAEHLAGIKANLGGNDGDR